MYLSIIIIYLFYKLLYVIDNYDISLIELFTLSIIYQINNELDIRHFQMKIDK